MTIENTTRSVRTQGNDATTVFDYDFLIPTGTLVVILYDADAETYTELAASEYSVTGLDNVNGGTVTYPLAGTPITPTQYLIIRRDVPYTQPLDIANQGGFFADTVMEQLDRTAMMTQQLAEVQARSLITIEGDEFSRPMPIKSALAGNTLAFDANGEPTTGPSVGAVAAAGGYASEAAAALAGAAAARDTAEAWAEGTLPGGAGTKSAKEWADAALSAVPNVFPVDRTELAAVDTATHTVAYLTEAGREGTFLWDGSDLSTYVTADTQQGIYVAPASDTTGASGAWVRQVEGGFYSVVWFGAVADNVTDCTAQIQACCDLAISEGVGAAHFPAGSYKGYIALQDETNFRIFCDAPCSATLTTPDTAKPPINIFSNVGSGTTNHFSVENLKLVNASTYPAIRVWNALHFSLKLLKCYGTISIQGSGNFVVDNCEGYPTSGGSALAIGDGAIESASLTNSGPGIVLGGQFQGYGSTAIYINGDPLGIDFIGIMYSGTPADYSIKLVGPVTGPPRGSVNFWGCHGESNRPSSGEGVGADFKIGETYKFGHVGIYGGNSWAYDSGGTTTHYHGYGVQIIDAASVTINDWTADKLAAANGWNNGMIRAEATNTGSVDVRNITNNTAGRTYSGFTDVGATYSGDYSSRSRFRAGEKVTISGEASVAATPGTAINFGVTFASTPQVTATVRGAAAYAFLYTEPTTTGCTLVSSSGTQNVHWQATGVVAAA